MHYGKNLRYTPLKLHTLVRKLSCVRTANLALNVDVVKAKQMELCTTKHKKPSKLVIPNYCWSSYVTLTINENKTRAYVLALALSEVPYRVSCFLSTSYSVSYTSPQFPSVSVTSPNRENMISMCIYSLNPKKKIYTLLSTYPPKDFWKFGF